MPQADEARSRNIHQRMLEVMQKVDYVVKENKKVNNMYKFVSHDAVVAAIRPHLVGAGIATEVSVVGHDQDGNRTVVEVNVAFVNTDNPEDRISVNGFGYGIDAQDKGPGKAISYAIKYVLLKTFMLETGDDPERGNIDYRPDSRDADDEEERRAVSEERQQRAALYGAIQEFAKANGITATDINRKVGRSAAELTIPELEELVAKLPEWFLPKEERVVTEKVPEALSMSEVMSALSGAASRLGLSQGDVEKLAKKEMGKELGDLNVKETRDFVLVLQQLIATQGDK